MADKRLELHQQLKFFTPNVYFQPPSDLTMRYPCIVYHSLPLIPKYADDSAYGTTNGYQITVMDFDPDSPIAYNLIAKFNYCRITNHFVLNNLNHTTLQLYY